MWGADRFAPALPRLSLRAAVAVAVAAAAAAASASARDGANPAPPVVGGSGDWTFRYRPDRLALPPESCASDGCNCHGLVVDRDGNIYLTYEPDHSSDDVRCMVRFRPDGTGGVPFGSPDLCAGTPHGLTLVEEEDGEEYLYHANNRGAVLKTRLDGTIVWSNVDRPPTYADDMKYAPTWVVVPPGSEHAYLVDGYGSQFVHVLEKSDGRFVEGRAATHGGRGSDPGTFSTCHGIEVDSRPRRGSTSDNSDPTPPLIVSDRENHRHQLFRYDPLSPSVFEYESEFAVPGLDRVCHFRTTPDGGHAVVPALEGPVGILDEGNDLVSVIDVAGLLGHEGHLHPHDAIILPSGDMVVATWNPGRVSYWQRVAPPSDDDGAFGQSLA